MNNDDITIPASNPKYLDFYAFLLSSILIGFIVGIASALFLRFLDWNIHFLWEVLPQWIAPNNEIPFYALIVCTIGGTIIGLCQKYLGNHPPSLAETLATFRKTGRVEYKHLPHGIVNVLVSLIFGGSLGPEAGLTDMIGGLVTWLGDLRKQHNYIKRILTQAAMSAGLAFFGSPLGGAVLTFETSDGDILPRIQNFLPSLLGTCAGFAGFVWAMGNSLGKNFIFPAEMAQPVNMLLAIPVALIGAGGGMIFHLLSTQLNKYFSPLASRPLLRGIIGGVGLGIMGSLMPLTLFSGEHELRVLIDESAKMGFLLLFVLGVAKMLATTLCLATGWKGGIIFPPMFGGAALGLACSVLFPAIHPMVGVTAGMAATTAVIMRQPVAVIIILLGILRGETAGVIVVATLVGYTVTMPFFPSKVKNNTNL